MRYFRKRDQTRAYKYHLFNNNDFKDLSESARDEFRSRVEPLSKIIRGQYRLLRKQLANLIKLPENLTIRLERAKAEDQATMDIFNRILGV